MYNVLIVDEEEHLLSALEQNLFPDRDDIAILTADNGERGLDHLKDQRIDLLISDIKMPGKIDGFQLILRAKEVAPDARVIIMTAFGNHRVQNFADRIGITHYIEKPFNTSELRDAVLEILDEKQGFQGVLSDLELTDIIQMLCLARRTALLHLKHRDHRGRIVFETGEVVHAEFDDETGENAVYRMLALRQGDIFMQSDFRNEERTIETGWQDLLFEGVRRADEERAAISEEFSDAQEGAEDEDGPDTNVGMGVNSDDVDAIVQGGPDIDDEPEPEGSFFSEDELREIELAGVDAVEELAEEDEGIPFATLDEEPAAGDGRFGAPNGAPEDDDFRTPFQREQSSLMAGAALPPEDGEAPRRVPTETQAVPQVDVHDVSPDMFRALLEDFARQCPGFRQSCIVSVEDGLPFSEYTLGDGYDVETLAPLFVDVATGATRTVEALADESFTELQVAAGDQWFLVRALNGTPYLHVAVVSQDVSLGVALVLMRRLQKDFYARMEA